MNCILFFLFVCLFVCFLTTFSFFWISYNAKFGKSISEFTLIFFISQPYVGLITTYGLDVNLFSEHSKCLYCVKGNILTYYTCHKLLFTSVATLLILFVDLFVGCCSNTSIIYAKILLSILHVQCTF